MLGVPLKRMSLVSAAMLAALLVTPALAHAQTEPAAAPVANPPKPDPAGFYLGAGISSLWLDSDYAASGLPFTFEDQARLPAISGRLGYTFNEYIAVEVEAATGLESTGYAFTGGPQIGDIKLESAFGAYVVGTVPVSANVYLMGRAGLMSYSVARTYLGNDPGSLDGDGAAYGAGIGYREGKLDYRIEYNGVSADGVEGYFGLSAAYRF